MMLEAQQYIDASACMRDGLKELTSISCSVITALLTSKPGPSCLCLCLCLASEDAKQCDATCQRGREYSNILKSASASDIMKCCAAGSDNAAASPEDQQVIQHCTQVAQAMTKVLLSIGKQPGTH